MLCLRNPKKIRKNRRLSRMVGKVVSKQDKSTQFEETNVIDDTLCSVHQNVNDESDVENSSKPEDIFEDKLKNIIRSGFTLVGISIGKELDLFKAMKGKSTVTSEELAKETHCRERYVREWLHFMVVSDIVEVDPSGTTFSLPDQHIQALLHNMGDIQLPLPHLTSAHDHLIQNFKQTSNDVKLPCHTRISPIQITDDVLLCSQYVRKSIDGLSHGLDNGISVCQIRCTRGAVLQCLASIYPKSSFKGLEDNETAMESAIQAAAQKRLQNIKYETANFRTISKHMKEELDLFLMFESLHDLNNPGEILQDVYDCVKPGGRLVMFDTYTFSNPYLTATNELTKDIAQRRYLSSLYESLPAVIHSGSDNVLGTCPGIEHLCKLMKQAKFILEKAEVVQDTSNIVLVGQKMAW